MTSSLGEGCEFRVPSSSSYPCSSVLSVVLSFISLTTDFTESTDKSGENKEEEKRLLEFHLWSIWVICGQTLRFFGR
jgi:hypothetical protein